MSIVAAGTLWVLGAAAIAVLIAIPVHRFSRLGHDERRANDSVSGVFTIVSGLHAVVMAFVLISLFEAASSVTEDAYAEANGLVGVHWASDSLPAPARDQVQELTGPYARTVAEQEWPRMREGEPVGGTGSQLLERMRMAIDAAPAESVWQQQRRLEAADQLWEVYEARQQRLAAPQESGVSTVVWLVLVVGSVLSIVVPYLFDVPRLVTRMIAVGALAGTVALLMFAIYQLQNPFVGVGPDAFNATAEQLALPAG